MARPPQERLEDLRAAIDRIERAVASFDQTSFEQADPEILVPICLWFIVVGEAVKALPEDVQDRSPAVDWRGFARFREVLTHPYFRTDRSLLWKAISRSLPPLRDAVHAELARTATS